MKAAVVLALCIVLAASAFAQEVDIRITNQLDGYPVFYDNEFEIEVEVRAPSYVGNELRSLAVSARGLRG